MATGSILRLTLLTASIVASTNVHASNCERLDCGDLLTPKRVVTTRERSPPTKPVAVDVNNLREDEKGIAAVARIFQLKYFMYPHTIEILSPESAMIDGSTVEPIPASHCAYRLRRRDGAITAQISFNKLSGEYRAVPVNEGRTNLVITGQGKSVCENLEGFPGQIEDGDQCYSALVLSILPSATMSALRAFRYIFSNVCRPAEIPF